LKESVCYWSRQIDARRIQSDRRKFQLDGRKVHLLGKGENLAKEKFKLMKQNPTR
jgi:hypothetical protein